jgi:hypothetical protein
LTVVKMALRAGAGDGDHHHDDLEDVEVRLGALEEAVSKLADSGGEGGGGSSDSAHAQQQQPGTLLPFAEQQPSAGVAAEILRAKLELTEEIHKIGKELASETIVKLEGLNVKLEGTIVKLDETNAKLEGMNGKLDETNAKLDRTNVSGEIGGLRLDLRGLRGEIKLGGQGLRGEIRRTFQDLEGEMTASISRLRADRRRQFSSLLALALACLALVTGRLTEHRG